MTEHNVVDTHYTNYYLIKKNYDIISVLKSKTKVVTLSHKSRKIIYGHEVLLFIVNTDSVISHLTHIHVQTL